MTAMDGKKLAERRQQEIAQEIAALKAESKRAPGLAVILVGDDPASKVYVNSKKKAAEALGIFSLVIALPARAKRQEVFDRLWQLNDDPRIDAILVQLPLPRHLDTWEILDQVHPDKDADCLHPLNQGRLFLGRSDFFPCTPAGVVALIDHYRIGLEGMNAAVVGRSFLVGKPLALMLSQRNATVTLCHSRTKGLAEITRGSDLVVAAVGTPGLITADMLREGVVLVDVGINRVGNEEECSRYCSPEARERFQKNGSALVGDIHYRAYEKASYYTPVPRGVGPMTVTMLMHNTLLLYKKSNGGG